VRRGGISLLEDVVMSYRQILVLRPECSGGGYGLKVGTRVYFQPILEHRTEHDLRQLVVAVEPAPAFLRGVDELEHHG